MSTPIDGRELLYTLSQQNREKCRQAIAAFRKEAPTLPQEIDAEAMKRLRFDLAKKLSTALFDPKQPEIKACLVFLGEKQKKAQSNLVEHPSWKKLFDKIVAQEPGQQMLSLKEKDQKKTQKDIALLNKRWQDNETQINECLAKHNEEIAKLDFTQLAAEIDKNASPVSQFKDRLRQWASSKQPVLQDLFQIPNLVKDFSDWQKELIKDLADTYERDPLNLPPSAIKIQVRLLTRKLAACIAELQPYRCDQEGVVALLKRRGVMPWTGEELLNLKNALSYYDKFVPKCEGAKEKLLARAAESPNARQPVANAAAQAPQKEAAGQPIRPHAMQDPIKAPIRAPNQSQGKAQAAQAQNPAQPNLKANPKPNPKAPIVKKSNPFVAFLKSCGNLFVRMITFPFRLLGRLFGTGKPQK